MTVESLCEQIILTKNPFVHIYEGARVTQHSKAAFCTADCVDSPEALTPETGADLVQNFMASAAPGQYVARMMKDKNGGKSQRELKFSKEGVQQPVNQVSGFNLQEEAERIAMAKIEAFKAQLALEQKIAGMAAQISGLETQLREESSRTNVSFFVDMLVEKLSDSEVVQNIFGRRPRTAPGYERPPARRPATEPVSGAPAPESVSQQPAAIDEAEVIPSQEALDAEAQVIESAEAMAEKIPDHIAPLMQKLSALDAAKLAKLADMPQSQIDTLTSML